MLIKQLSIPDSKVLVESFHSKVLIFTKSDRIITKILNNWPMIPPITETSITPSVLVLLKREKRLRRERFLTSSIISRDKERIL
jgi:hypothetical protein